MLRKVSSSLVPVLLLVSLVTAIAATLIFTHQDPAVPPGSPAHEQPSSSKPHTAAVVEYSVAADLPKYIDIPAIGIEKSRIFGLGIRDNGAIDTPSNLYDTGWYTGSAKPGQSGTVFLFGHLSNWQSKGVFYNLKQLKPGDNIIITRGDDKKFIYQVAGSATYEADKVDMNEVLSPIDDKQQGLNLMTCEGKVIKGTSDFTHRLVVYAYLPG